MKLLLLSNSTCHGEEYLSYPMPYIADFLEQPQQNCLFIPYAAVGFSYDDYEAKVQDRFQQINHNLTSIHHYTDKKTALKETNVIVVGGGNTFHLLKCLQELDLLASIQETIRQGTPYIGWSAGSNLAGPSIRTTNDMPIVEPQSFNALNLVHFQINPHYIEANPEGHAGETREQRISEFLAANPKSKVVGIPEGTLLEIKGNETALKGKTGTQLFQYGEAKQTLPNDTNLTTLL